MEVTRETVRPLLDLQRVDLGIDRLEQRRIDLPEQRELDALGESRAEVAGRHAERQAALDEVARIQTRLEGEVAMLEEKITHESGRLYGGSVSNPKELASIQAELDALRRRKAHVEDSLLDALEKREGVESETGALKEELDALDRGIAEATEHRDAASVEIETELTELSAHRAALRPPLPAEILDLYDDLRERKQGVGVAALEGGVCRGCNVSLSPLAIDEIRRSDDPVPRCENCRRILVVT